MNARARWVGISGLVAICAAAGGGAIASEFTSPHRARDVVVSTAAAPVATSPDAPSITVTRDPKLDEMELRLRALEASRTDRPAIEPRDDHQQAGAPPTTDDAIQKSIAAHDRWVARFDGEGVDGSWASREETALSDALDRHASALGMTSFKASCRSTMCKVDTQWPSFGDASSNALKILGIDGPSCAIQVFLPPPEHASDPYQTTVYLDCEGERIASAR